MDITKAWFWNLKKISEKLFWEEYIFAVVDVVFEKLSVQELKQMLCIGYSLMVSSVWIVYDADGIELVLWGKMNEQESGGKSKM